MCAIIAGLAAIGFAVVCLRAEQARCAAVIVRLESEWTEARRSLWSLQARAARLRSPRQVHDRTVFLQAGVVPPLQGELTPRSPEQLARSTKDGRNGSRRTIP